MGDKKKTTVINKTSEDVKIRVYRGVIIPPKDYDIRAGDQRDINGTKLDGSKKLEKLATVMIYCDERRLLDSKSVEWASAGEEFFGYKTVTIEVPGDIVQVPGDQNSTRRVKYIVRFEQGRNPATRELFRERDLVLEHDNGWYVQHCEDGIVKLTRKEGMTMTLDPSKLFATVVDPVETSLLKEVLKFWPRTFADLNCKDDLGTTIGIVNDLIRLALKLRHVHGLSEVEDKKVVENVGGLHNSCAAMVEWYSPLFPNIQFPKVEKQMAEVDQVKLKRFESTIEDTLRKS